MNDNVNHPSHYTQGPVHDRCGEVVECITVTEGMNFNVGNAVKYLWRHDAKDNGANALQDLEKARWYITREIERRQYEAARNEPELPLEDDVKPAKDFTVTMGAFRPRAAASGHTHLNGYAFDRATTTSPLAGLFSALFGATEPGDDDDDDEGPATMDDTNSHVCVTGQRVPGTECGFRRLFGDTTGTGV